MIMVHDGYARITVARVIFVCMYELLKRDHMFRERVCWSQS